MSDSRDWNELIDRHLHGELNEAEKERLAELLDSDSSARKEFVEQAQWDTRLAETLRGRRDGDQELEAVALLTESAAKGSKSKTTTFVKALLAIAAVVIAALTASLYLQRPIVERQIAKLTGLSGPLQWTGDGGRVHYNLSVGAELAGGTVKGMTPSSWFELEFNDGSTVTISGDSMLTFSDHGQKKLYLKEGSLSSNVKPQPAGKPMLVYTRSALLEVLGTQFDVDSELAATTLNVSKGSVRIKRFSDGSTVDVPAKHRVVAAADRDLSPVLVPDSVDRWISQLHLGPDHRGNGRWLPGSNTQSVRLEAIPYTLPHGLTIYVTSFNVYRGDEPPVMLRPASRLRVRGHITSPHSVFFGITVRHAGGEFAGRFQTIRPASEFLSGKDFDVTLDLRDFQLDPSLAEWKDKLPDNPFNLVVESIWCHTLDKPAGLALTEVELIPAVEDRRVPLD